MVTVSHDFWTQMPRVGRYRGNYERRATAALMCNCSTGIIDQNEFIQAFGRQGGITVRAHLATESEVAWNGTR